MMFILDGIACFFEEIGLAVEEKICMLRDPTSRSRGSSTGGEEKGECEEDQIVIIDEGESESENTKEQENEEDDSLDDFDEYLRKCALGVLFPPGTQENGEHPKEEEQSAELPEKSLTESTKEELKEAVQMVLSKLSEDDKKEILDSFKSKGLGTDVSELFDISMELSEENAVFAHN